MKFDEETNYWIDENGHRYVRNEFDPTHPTLIAINDTSWSAYHLNKRHVLTWPAGLHPTLKGLVEDFLKFKLRRASPTYLNHVRLVLRQIVGAQSPGLPFKRDDLTDPAVIRHIWKSTLPSYRPLLRTLVSEVVKDADPSSYVDIALMMSKWKSKRALCWMKSVLEWDPDQGSLTSAELELLRRHLVVADKRERGNDHFARLFAWLSLCTLRRPSQLIQIDGKGLRRITTQVGTTADVRIPGVKVNRAGFAGG